jgi:hypothetical protein
MSMSCGLFVQFFKCEILMLGKFVSFIAAVLWGTKNFERSNFGISKNVIVSKLPFTVVMTFIN